jgi:FAD/FMN-containing dehydrogenase
VDLSALCAAVADAPAVVAVGAQTQWELGAPVIGAKEVRAPAGVVAYEPEDMTITVGAGTPVAEIVTVLGAHGQECALDPRDTSATVGGVLACGLSGVRRLRHGPIREQVLEVRFVTGAGRVVKGGGPTVKNVTGYDLPRLMVGSFGTLGVLARVTLRCRPRAQVAKWFRATEPPTHIYRPAAMLWNETGVHVRCEGNASDVDAQGAGLDECESPVLPEGPHRGRISIAPGAVTALVADLADARWCAELGVGTVHVAADTAAALQGARDTAHRHGGWLLREAGGDGMDAFGRDLPNRALMARIKAAFDPTGKLAPGRLPL